MVGTKFTVKVGVYLPEEVKIKLARALLAVAQVDILDEFVKVNYENLKKEVPKENEIVIPAKVELLPHNEGGRYWTTMLVTFENGGKVELAMPPRPVSRKLLKLTVHGENLLGVG